MVKNLPDLSQLVTHQTERHIEYSVLGTAIGFSLWYQSDVAVQRLFLLKETVFPEHNHQEHEYVILVSGSIKRTGKGTIIGPHINGVLNSGGCIYYAPGTPHSSEILENSWVISVTIPASEAYPGGRE
jgi:quercetin dioxygenase-like cupin family protein